MKPEKIAVTGIPNFDHVDAFRDNDFPHRHYVLATTSSLRETFKWDDRLGFIEKARRIADGRRLIFKLHPNEDTRRARREIESRAPGALIYEDGNVNHMIANCDVLVSQFSSVILIGLALGKEVHAEGGLETFRHLTPLQNGGISARRIAEICRQLLEAPQPVRKPETGVIRSRLGRQVQDVA